MPPSPADVTLRWAAALSWGAVGLPIALRFAAGGGPDRNALVQAACWLLFGVSFWRCEPAARRGRARGRVLLGLQSLAAIVILNSDGGVVAVVLLVMVATQMPMLLSDRQAVLWILVQTAAVCVPAIAARPTAGLVAAGAALGFQFFALGVMHLARREALSRQELARVNAELHTAQSLLEDSTRLAERVRISRELHDTLGHHLTALSINLELAATWPRAGPSSPCSRRRRWRALLLAEVRNVVGDLREEAALDLAGALRALAAGIPHPQVALSLPADLDEALRDTGQTQAIFRCVQETVTNAVRHAVRATCGSSVARSTTACGWSRATTGGARRSSCRATACAACASGSQDRAAASSSTSQPGGGFTLIATLRLGGRRPQPPRRMIRVALVEDQTLVRQGIRSLLELCCRHRRSWSRPATARKPWRGCRRPPSTWCCSTCACRASPASRCCGSWRGRAAAADDPAHHLRRRRRVVLDGMRAGARGFLLKDVSLEQLTRRSARVAAGGTLIQPAVTERVLRGLRRVPRDIRQPRPAGPADPPRDGDPAADGGWLQQPRDRRALGTAEGTVKNHASSILSKLGVRDRTRAVLRALEIGWL